MKHCLLFLFLLLAAAPAFAGTGDDDSQTAALKARAAAYTQKIIDTANWGDGSSSHVAAMRSHAAAYAQKIADRCWKLSEAERSNKSTYIMNLGHVKTAQCFEDEYIGLIKSISRHPFAGHHVTAAEIRRRFAALKEPYMTVYYDIQEIGCRICGSMTENIVRAQYSNLMQQIVSDLVYQIYADDMQDFLPRR